MTVRFFVASFVASSVVLLAGFASSAASADERCTGTLCDWYYGGSPPEQTVDKPQAAPQPLTVPSLPGSGTLGRMFGSSPAPANGSAAGAAPSRPLVGVGGGGIAAMARGETAERCTGTLCDFFYGGPPPEKPEARTSGDQTAPATAEAAAAAEADAEPEPRPRSRLRVRETVEAAPPRCAAAMGRDPWSCYR